MKVSSKQKSTALLLTALATFPIGSAGAAVLAFTNFDSRTATGLTASNLNWTVNGFQDPGNMTAVGAPSLFDGSAVTQNSFTPGINTGNGNTSWTTEVSLTVAGGNNVTLTDVSFVNLSVNAGQAINVDRRNDFTITLLSPTAAVLDSIDIIDSVSGTTTGTPTVTATFGAPIPLTAPGTYTLVIRGGDYLGNDETGNHTGIDNLSINGDLAPIPEPTSALLAAFGLLAVLRRQRK